MSNEVTLFGETTFRNRTHRFGIKPDDRRRHMYLIGKTGMGKTTVLENMIIEDIQAGRGVAVVDPHGELAEKVIEYIPNNRINDVIYFNPADIDYPIAFNVVEQVDPHLRHLVASGLIGVFQKLWADSWGPRLEYILRNSILAVLEYPGSTLLAITRMLSDKAFRKKVIAKIKDPVVRSFWVNEFAGYADKFAAEAVSPIQNKVGQFLSSSVIRNIIGQVKSAIDMREIMDNGKILIMNLSKGRIGEDNSALLGAMMITKLQLAAMSRVDMPEKDRRDFYLYIDEFQNFCTESFANILSEARKYRLNLIMAHQYIEQLGDLVKAAVFGNVGTMVVFRVGAADSEELVPEFTPVFTEEDIVNLPKYEYYIKLMIDGIASDPFSARGLPPLPEDYKTDNAEKVIGVSRERYARKREIVEDKIMRWHENTDEADSRPVNRANPASRPPARQQPPRSNVRPPADNRAMADSRVQTAGTAASVKTESAVPTGVYRHQAVCHRCGKETMTSFKPDGIRPVYCKDCLSAVREEKRLEIENRKKAKQAELERLNEAEPVAEISLADALKKPPVNFKNRPQSGPIPENNPEAASIHGPGQADSGAGSSRKDAGKNGEIALGEEVTFD